LADLGNDQHLALLLPLRAVLDEPAVDGGEGRHMLAVPGDPPLDLGGRAVEGRKTLPDVVAGLGEPEIPGLAQVGRIDEEGVAAITVADVVDEIAALLVAAEGRAVPVEIEIGVDAADLLGA